MFVYYFHVHVRGYLSMQWNSSTWIKIVPDISDAFLHFEPTSEVSHFPDPSAVPVQRQILSRRVSLKTLMTQSLDTWKLLPRAQNLLRSPRHVTLKNHTLIRRLINVGPPCAPFKRPRTAAQPLTSKISTYFFAQKPRAK